MYDRAFDIPLMPTAKGTARATNRGGFARIYTPEKTRQAERDLISHLTQYAPETVIEGPVALSLCLVFPIPKSYRNIAWGQPHTKKPDTSNILKLVEDALKRSGQFFRDDSQIALVRACKVYGEKPCVQVRIVELSPTAKLMLR